jgi:L-threonylcarbamoyladenylate synthase
MTEMFDLTAASIERAAEILRRGGVVAFPTETVYGLGADATNGEAVARIYEAKGRPLFNPLIAHVPDVGAAERLVAMDAVSRRLAQRFWPGPLTLVLPRRADCPVSELATAGLPTLAVRVPDHAVARALLTAVGRSLAAPSANRSGHVSPTTAAHVMSDLKGRIAGVIDGGATAVGVESTIVQVMDGVVRMLRPGGISREDIAAVSELPVVDAAGDESAPVAPGMLASHYAPNARVRLDAVNVEPGEALLAFGPAAVAGAERAAAVMNLSRTGDLREAAANLFGMLRALDRPGVTGIAVAPVPETGLGEAIADRLKRAAATR